MTSDEKSRGLEVHGESRSKQWPISDDFFFFFAHVYFPASGQAAVTGVVPSPPRFLAFIFFIAHRVQQSH